MFVDDGNGVLTPLGGSCTKLGKFFTSLQISLFGSLGTCQKKLCLRVGLLVIDCLELFCENAKIGWLFFVGHPHVIGCFLFCLHEIVCVGEVHQRGLL